MIYRPHFAYPTPEGCNDEPYEYYYDQTNVQVLSLAAGATIPAILMGPLDKDAPFCWRGFRIQQNATPNAIAVQWRVNGELLSDDTINLGLYGVGAGFAGQFQGGQAVAWDEEIMLPAGAVIESTWSNEKGGTTFALLPFPGVTLWGVKRYHQDARRAA